jgi:hypothetical protein
MAGLLETDGHLHMSSLDVVLDQTPQHGIQGFQR